MAVIDHTHFIEEVRWIIGRCSTRWLSGRNCVLGGGSKKETETKTEPDY